MGIADRPRYRPVRTAAMRQSARLRSGQHPQPARTAVIYVRVSSKEQEKEGFSIAAQQKLLRQYASEQGFDLVREFVDVETAKRAGRTGFGETLGFFKKNAAKCRVLLVEKTDRLYRNLKADFRQPFDMLAKTALSNSASDSKENPVEASKGEKKLAPRHGFEPRLTAPKAAVLPLDDRGVAAVDPLSVAATPATLQQMRYPECRAAASKPALLSGLLHLRQVS